MIAYLMTVIVLLGFVRPATSQSTSSQNYFVTNTEQGPGASGMQSTAWKLDGSFASGVAGARTLSSSFVLEATWLGSATTQPKAIPWVSGVDPCFSPIGTKTKHRIHGTQLHLGQATTVSLGGVAARVDARRIDRVDVTLGDMRIPGWQALMLRNGGGQTTLARGIGIKPMLDIETPFDHQGSYGSEIVYHGTQGDLVVWMLSGAKSPVRIPLLGYHYGFELDFSTMFVLTATAVTKANGRGSVALPPIKLPASIWAQGLVIAPAASYSPGAFTNPIRM